MSYLWARQAEGSGIEQAAAELGIRKATLHRWAAAKPAAAFIPVRVVEAPAARLVVHGPGGIRVEGLDVAAVADLLRRLA